MKYYLNIARYKENYNDLWDCRELERLPQDESEIWNEDRFYEFIFSVKWLTEIYTKQSIERFAKWAFNEYKKEMIDLFNEVANEDLSKKI